LDEIPVALAHHTAIIHNGYFYVLGGTNSSFEKSSSTPFYRLQLKNNLWQKLKSPDEDNYNET